MLDRSVDVGNLDQQLPEGEPTQYRKRGRLNLCVRAGSLGAGLMRVCGRVLVVL